MDKNQFFKKDALRPTGEQRLLTQEFYRNANVIYRRFDDWKDVDRFYFISLYLEMTYCINGIVAELAPNPVWLGSFVRCVGGRYFPIVMLGRRLVGGAIWKGIVIVGGKGSRWFRGGLCRVRR